MKKPYGDSTINQNIFKSLIGYENLIISTNQELTNHDGSSKKSIRTFDIIFVKAAYTINRPSGELF